MVWFNLSAGKHKLADPVHTSSGYHHEAIADMSEGMDADTLVSNCLIPVEGHCDVSSVAAEQSL